MEMNLAGIIIVGAIIYWWLGVISVTWAARNDPNDTSTIDGEDRTDREMIRFFAFLWPIIVPIFLFLNWKDNRTPKRNRFISWLQDGGLVGTYLRRTNR